MRQITILLFILFSINSLFSEASDDIILEISHLERIQETIKYGIEKEVVAVLEEIGPTPKKSFYPSLLERYKEAVLADTKIAFINYFSECDNLPENILDLLYNEAKSLPDNIKIFTTLLVFLGTKGQVREGLFLIEMLDNTNIAIQNTASDALSQLKNANITKHILKRLELSEINENKFLTADIKSKLILSFGNGKSKEVVKYLKKVISDKLNDKYIIMYGMLSLAKIGDIDSIPLISKNLKNEERKIQKYAAYSLSLYKTKSVTPILEKMLKNNNEKIRIYACQGLVLNKNYNSVNVLLYKFKNDPSTYVKKEALSSLVHLGNPGINSLKIYMKDKEYTNFNLNTISEAMAKKPNIEGVQFLVSLYKSADEKQKELITKTLISGTSNILDPIIKILFNSNNYLIRIGALKIVYNIKKSSLWNIVIGISKNDPSNIVKKIALKYLDLKKIANK